MSESWKPERPSWCPHASCKFILSTQAVACIGSLPQPADHDGTANTHRFCIKGAPDDGEWLFDLKVNRGDVWAFRRLFDAAFPRGGA